MYFLCIFLKFFFQFAFGYIFVYEGMFVCVVGKRGGGMKGVGQRIRVAGAGIVATPPGQPLGSRTRRRD